MIAERISLGGVGARGFALGATASVTAGDETVIDFESDKPVSPQQFFSLADAVGRLLPVDVISIAPLSETRFRAVVKWRESGTFTEVGKAETIDGVRFTLVSIGGPNTSRRSRPSPAKLILGVAAIPMASAGLGALAGRKFKRPVAGAVVGAGAGTALFYWGAMKFWERA